MDVEATSPKAPVNVRAYGGGGEGGLTYRLRRSSLPGSLEEDFFFLRFSPLSAVFGSIVVGCVFVFVPFQDEHSTIFWGGTRQGCSA